MQINYYYAKIKRNSSYFPYFFMPKDSYWLEFLFSSKNVLLLQGPVGDFFLQLQKYLVEKKKNVYKINLNAGDDYFFHDKKSTYSYRGTYLDFETYLANFVKSKGIDSIVVFGQSRLYHRIAKRISVRENINFWVFEEGYLRPNFVTFEKSGVNSSSLLPKNAQFYLQENYSESACEKPREVASGFFPRAWDASRYYLALNLRHKKYPYYRHHRSTNVWNYAGAWMLAGWRGLYYRFLDKKISQSIQQGDFPPFFIVPLQVYNDSQITDFGRSNHVPQFIRTVLSSFTKNAPPDTHIILKHHPMDRGFNNYQKLIEALAQKYDIVGRVHYVFMIPMPVFLRSAQGMVIVNSTSGLSALLHQIPVKVLGLSPYDFAGLTDQQHLDDFWQSPQKPDKTLADAYRGYLRQKTQLNANFNFDNSQAHLLFDVAALDDLSDTIPQFKVAKKA